MKERNQMKDFYNKMIEVRGNKEGSPSVKKIIKWLETAKPESLDSIASLIIAIDKIGEGQKRSIVDFAFAVKKGESVRTGKVHYPEQRTALSLVSAANRKYEDLMRSISVLTPKQLSVLPKVGELYETINNAAKEITKSVEKAGIKRYKKYGLKKPVEEKKESVSKSEDTSVETESNEKPDTKESVAKKETKSTTAKKSLATTKTKVSSTTDKK